jgi:hypothetical protein
MERVSAGLLAGLDAGLLYLYFFSSRFLFQFSVWFLHCLKTNQVGFGYFHNLENF